MRTETNLIESIERDDVLVGKTLFGKTLAYEVKRVYPNGILGDDDTWFVAEVVRISKRLRDYNKNEWISFGNNQFISINKKDGKPLMFKELKNIGKQRGFEIERRCNKCGNDQYIRPVTVVGGHPYYNSDLDFCPKCGEIWF